MSFVLQDVYPAVFDVVVGDLRYGRRICDPTDEQQGGQNHPGLDCDCKVSEHSEREGHQPDTDVGLGQFQQLRDLAPLAHVVGDHQQNSCQRCHRNKTGQVCGKQEHTDES